MANRTAEADDSSRGRRASAATAVSKVISGLVVVFGLLGGVSLFVGGPFQPIAQWGSWHLQRFTVSGTPTCAHTSWLSNTRSATTEAYYERSDDYNRFKATDGDPTTAWLEQFHKSDPRNWIRWDFDDPTKLRLICLLPGYTKNYDTYVNNERPRTVRVSGAGCASATYQLANYADFAGRSLKPGWDKYQSLKYSCQTSSVTLTILRVYPAMHPSNDVGFSEAAFYATKLWPT